MLNNDVANALCNILWDQNNPNVWSLEETPESGLNCLIVGIFVDDQEVGLVL